MAVEDKGPEDAREKRRRIYNVYRGGLLAFTLMYTFFYAGAFFGYGPMILLLQKDSAFAWECDDNDTSSSTCPDQTSQLLNIHFVGTLTQIVTPFVGHLSDTRGPFATMLYTAMTALAGVAMLILSRAVNVDQLLYPAFCFLAMNAFATSIMCVITGGVFKIYDKEYVLRKNRLIKEDSNSPQETQPTEGSSDCKEEQIEAFDKGPRRVIGLLNNLFDAGSITYLILWETHKSLGTSLQVLCYWYLGAGIFMFGGAIACWILILKHQEQDKRIQEEADEQSKPSATTEEDGANVTKTENDDNDGPETAEPSALESETEEGSKGEWRQLYSASYLWLVAFFAFHVGRNIFVLTSAEAFLKNLGDTNDKYITIFTMMMPASIIGFPFVDWALGRYGYHMALQLINILGLVHGIIQISATANLNIQIIGFLVFSFYRCFLFSVIFAYLAALMPEKVLGKANGMLHISAGKNKQYKDLH